MRIEQVVPASGNGHHRIGSLPRMVICTALVTLTGLFACQAETLTSPTKLSLSPLPAPIAIATDTNSFSLAIDPRPKPAPATNRISSGSSDATRRVLEVAACLDKQGAAAKGSHTGLFSTRVGSPGFGIAGIQAGYGMVLMDPVFRQDRNGTAMEEPSYIVVRTSLKF